MKIGIIGAGMIGGTLARRLAPLGHEVFIANSRGPETLRELAAEAGVKPVSVEDAVSDKDLVVVTIPEKNVPNLPPALFKNVPVAVPVVDTCNYYPKERDGRIEPIENGITESRWVSRQIGHSVIKAFNNIMFKKLMSEGKPAGTPGRLALPVAGDDAAAKSTVMKLVEELGFDAVDAGSLDESWRQQPGSPCYVTDSTLDELKRRLADAHPKRQPKFSGTANSPGSFTDPR